MNKRIVTTVAPRNNAPVPLPPILRKKLGDLRIDAASLGDGRVGFVVEGPPVAVAKLAKGLLDAGLYTETYPEDPSTLYAESGTRESEVEEDDEVTRRYPAGFTSAMMAIGGAL